MVHNLLVVSDVHLCRLRPRMMEGGQRHFAAFLDHFARTREAGAPWCLVVNGDLLDFDHQAESVAERGPEEASLRLFREIARAHEDVFRSLGRFLDAGHAIVVIPGNHDVDLNWPSVRDAFRAEVARHAAGASIERLTFRDWFHHEPGRIWIEHGHAYEPDTAQLGMLDPFDGAEGGPFDGSSVRLERSDAESKDALRLRRNLGTWWIADFCPHITEIAYHVDHTRSPLYYIPIAARRLGLRAPILWLHYLGFLLRALAYAGGARSRPGARHDERRRTLAHGSGLADETLRALEAGMPRPRIASKLATAARLHAIPAMLLPVVLGLTIAAIAAGAASLGVAAVALFAVVLAVNVGVSSRFHGSAVEHLRRGARHILRTTGVPVVVMGHVHVATDEAHDAGRYLNSGTWADPRTPLSYVRMVGHDAALCEFAPPGVAASESSRQAA